MTSSMLAAFFALIAAAAWGSGDFTGGLAARRSSPFHTVLVSYTVGMILLVIVALLRLEPLPPARDLTWGAAAGLSGMLGLGFLFRGFSEGRMGIVAPVSAVLAAAIPVVISGFTEGLPRLLQLAGFGLALVSIWLISRPEPFGGPPAGLGWALLAGAGFGGFFTALGQVSDSAVFWPLVTGRVAAFLVMAGFAAATRRRFFPAALPFGLLTLAGVLDVAGNLFFLLAMQLGRMDVTAVLGSLYPAVTTLLARFINREYMAAVQGFGVGLAVLAIALITL